MAERFDVIVVGARCAGAPTAMLLARLGYQVLLVDRAGFPSDTISTHLLHPTGSAALARWGLLDDLVATGCPPIERYLFNFDGLELCGSPRLVDGVATAYGPRRIVLDNLLVEGAAKAGVQVRERFRVDGVVIEDGRVVGIRGHGKDGPAVELRAEVVVGADGRRSQIARSVGATEYRSDPIRTAGYYSYWSGLPVDEFRVYVRGPRAVVVVPTHDDRRMVLVGWPYREYATNKTDAEHHYQAAIDQVHELAPLIRAARRTDRLVGTGDLFNGFRQSHGAGWALVGDAGYVRDPCTAHGMSDAFRDAELLTSALDDALSGRAPLDAALAGYQAARDAAVKDMYAFTQRLARMEPMPLPVRLLFGAMRGNQPAMDRFVGALAGTVPLPEFFGPRTTAGIVLDRLSRGIRGVRPSSAPA